MESVQHDLRRVPLSRRLLWGAVAGLLLGLAAYFAGGLSVLESYELRTLDWRQRALARATPAVDQVALVIIDDLSIEAMREDGLPFPWPRDVYEPVILFLKECGARAVVFDLYFPDPWRTKGQDVSFAEAMTSAGNVVLATKLDPGKPVAGDDEVVRRTGVDAGVWPYPPRQRFERIVLPIADFVKAARSFGFANVKQDRDNTVRRADLLHPFRDEKLLLPSLGFEAARQYLGGPATARVAGGRLEWGEARVPLGADGRMLVRFYGPEGTFPTKNFISVYRSFLDLQPTEEEEKEAGAEGAKPPERKPRIPFEFFRDKLVIVGINASGLEDVIPVAMSETFRGPEYHATVCANLIGGDFLRALGPIERLLVLLSLGLAAGLAAFAAWKPWAAALAVLGVGAVYGALVVPAFRGGLVLEVFFPSIVLVGVFLAETLAAYLLEGRQKREVSRAFSQYLSPIIIRDLMRNPESLKLGGETRDLTVYFSDIRGFSTFSEGMSEQELVGFLNLYLSAMTDVILDHRGVIDKYEGDLIMAFWGAPAPLETHSLEACLAVLEQQRALRALNERFQAEGRPRLVFRTGLNAGPAVVGNMGSSRRFAYTAMGDTVNLASRLEGANKFFGTLVMMSEAVRKGAGDAVLVRRLGRVQVVGKSRATLVYELLGAPGDVSAETLERARRSEEALAFLEEGRAAEALAILERSAALPSDPVEQLYLAKCREILGTSQTWNGVWVLTSKG